MNKFLQSLFAGLLLMVMFATKLNAQVAPIFQGADDQSAIGNSTSLSVAKPTNLNPGDFNGTPNTGGTTATPGISSSFTVSGVDVTNINFGITPCSVLNAGTDQTRFISAGTATSGCEKTPNLQNITSKFHSASSYLHLNKPCF